MHLDSEVKSVEDTYLKKKRTERKHMKHYQRKGTCVHVDSAK